MGCPTTVSRTEARMSPHRLTPTGYPESIGPGFQGRCLEELGWLRAGEGGAPPVPGEPRASSGLGGFGGSSTVFSA
jgi:hypothetical protein